MRLLALTIAAGLFAGTAFAQTAPATAPRTTAPAMTTMPTAPAKPMAAPAPMPARAGIQSYPAEAAAKAACGGDTVVWGNTSTKVYHMAGTRYYGKTKRGGYMCQKTADTGGYHAAKNGS